MYQMEMYYTTIKTHLESGKSQRSIANLLGIQRRTVKKIKDQVTQGNFPNRSRNKNYLHPILIR